MARIYLPTAAQMDSMIDKLDTIAKSVSSQAGKGTWVGVQRAVREGLAPRLFPIGEQFTVPHSVYGYLTFDVVAHNYLKNPKDETAPTMTLLLHDQLSAALQFDAPEAFYYAEEILPAGTYNFTLSAAYSSWAAGTYQFTLTQDLPKGGQLGIKNYADTALTATKVRAFASQSAATATEEVDITVGDGGTALGTFGVELNHSQRVSYGSNNYKESAIRQFLISEASAGNVWTPKIKFDRVPSWAASTAGFVGGLDDDFKAVVGAVALPCCANGTYEAPDSTVTKGQAYTLNDKFYLASRKEIFGTSDDIDDGSAQFPFYQGATDVDRIKLRSGSAAHWWVRTPNRYYATSVRIVYSSGGLNDNGAHNSCGGVPACTIM